MQDYLTIKDALRLVVGNTDPAGPTAPVLTNSLLSEYSDMPEISLLWAKKLLNFDEANKSAALRLIYNAVSEREWDKKPEIILASAARIFMDHDMHDYAEVIYKGSVLHYPEDTFSKTQLAKLYVETARPKEAIALLEPLLENNGTLDDIATTTLSHAYLNDANPKAAIALLAPCVQTGRSDPIMINMLGHAHLLDHNPKAAIALLKDARERGKCDTHTTDLLANAYIQDAKPQAAIALIKPFYEKDLCNYSMTATLAQAYIQDGKPKTAISMLEKLHDSGHGNVVTLAMLGNAHIHDGKPKTAIRLLKPFCSDGFDASLIAGTLAKAYCSAKDRKGFDELKKSVPSSPHMDYIDARLYCFENEVKKALEVVQPYMRGDINKVPKNILTLYVSLLGEEHPILPHIETALGEHKYRQLIISREEFRQDPLRAELRNDRMPTSFNSPELGGIPVLKAEKMIPVHFAEMHLNA